MSNNHIVEIKQFKYDPPDLVIAVGDSVKWINRDSSPHTATRTDAPTFDTGSIAKDQESSLITFTTPSSSDGFDYFCTPHPFMKAKVIVTLPGTHRARYSLSAAMSAHAHEKK